jgi:hypothetical protein
MVRFLNRSPRLMTPSIQAQIKVKRVCRPPSTANVPKAILFKCSAEVRLPQDPLIFENPPFFFSFLLSLTPFSSRADDSSMNSIFSGIDGSFFLFHYPRNPSLTGSNSRSPFRSQSRQERVCRSPRTTNKLLSDME